MGFFLGKGAYLRTFWGCLDFSIVVTGVIEVLLSQFVSLKSIRLMRAFRPLKSVTSMKSLKKIASSLVASLP
jgi:hypothetical protein